MRYHMTMPNDPHREYTQGALSENDVDADPIVQFNRWLRDADGAGIIEPRAMTVATSTRAGTPSARIVLLRGVDDHGFVFYTNYESRKGRELEDNPRAALVFHWIELERQVRIEGAVTRVSREESEAYYRGRPRGSRIGAWASPQSHIITGRDALDAAWHDVEVRFAGNDVPLPPFWGGYRVRPTAIEFWQGRPNRQHDRLLYIRANDTWRLSRLAP